MKPESETRKIKPSLDLMASHCNASQLNKHLIEICEVIPLSCCTVNGTSGNSETAGNSRVIVD